MDASTNTTLSHGLRDHLLRGSKHGPALAAVLDRTTTSYGRFEFHADCDSVVCFNSEKAVEMVITDASITVIGMPNETVAPLLWFMPLFHMCMGGPMRFTPRGWQTTGSVIFENQTVSGAGVSLMFRHTLGGLGLPRWIEPDYHPLTRHLQGVASNTAEVDPALSGDPLVFARRAFEVFESDACFVFKDAVHRAPPMRFVENNMFNRIFRRNKLTSYRNDKLNRPFMYSK